MTNSLAGILQEVKKLKSLKAALESLSDNRVVGLKAPTGLRPALVAAIFSKTKRTVSVVSPTIALSERFALEVSDYSPEGEIVALPDWESFPFESVRPDVAAIGRRTDIFQRLRNGKPLVVCLAGSTLLQKMPPVSERVYIGTSLSIGQELDMGELASLLIDLGYVRLSLVERPGEFAVRGSVVDIFPSQMPGPVRLDFFGDEIESIKLFDVASQRSTTELTEARVNPSREFRFNVEATERVLAAGGRSTVEEDAHRCLPLIYDLVAMNNYFPPETLWVINELKATYDESNRFFKDQEQTLLEGYTGDLKLSAQDYYSWPDKTWSELTPCLEMSLIKVAKKHFAIGFERPKKVAGHIDRLEKELNRLKKINFKTVLVLNDPGECDRLAELIGNMGKSFDRGENLCKSSLSLVVGNSPTGYVIPEIGLAVFGYSDIFPRREMEPQAAARPRRQTLVDFSDLVHGQLLVHEIHGIAAFAGLTRKTVAGKTREYLMLDYAAGDRLYLPADQLYKVSRYLGPEGAKPEITRLGSPDWLRAKRKVKNSLKKLAIDLLALYAERAKHPGYKFSPDTEWQRELEEAFPYVATQDQQTAINAVKKDMESVKPMDRLVCGDVGYGKTEVAVRAAFKAILDGKQVMMLVPTTILAQQHYLTFKERFAPYPVEVRMLSRFLTAAEQKEVVGSVKTGIADMVIGTHRLLQKDIKFKDLGLVIVDEEQRFGVNAKEKLRQLRRAVDVVTLSATPIPRTMQMSLSGVRDLSLIETPPEGRHPVLTSIGEFQATVIRSAIRRELARGGQVFYVHNRVETIEKAAAKIQNLVPEARVILGHGQMPESILEKVMLKFLNKEADVLVCTTIIESGIDITSANTLFVENADLLGLAQLYQLRGRVGRGHHRAYAYFSYAPGQILSGTAIERLKTIGEFTELGSGYKVALRDLEIRGAGNILGAEQHGQMISVGFDLYCQMLRREIDSLQGKVAEAAPDVVVELPVNAYLPESYIQDENLRLETYREIAGAVSSAELDSIRSELADRFGKPSSPVLNLLVVADLRIQAAAAGVVSIKMQKGRLAIKGLEAKREDFAAQYDLNIKAATGEVILRIPAGQPDILRFVIEFISAIMP